MFFRNIFNGMASYGKAFHLINKLGLWSYFVVPALISLVLAAGIGGVAVSYGGALGDWMASWCHGGWICDKIGSLFHLLGGILVAAVGLILFKNLAMAAASPFMSLLSEKIEKSLYGVRQEPKANAARMVREFIRGLSISLRNIFRELLFTLLAGFVPVIGPFLIFFIQSYYAGFGNMDYTLERHLTLRQSIGFVRQNRGLAIGNGIVFLLMLMTLIGFVFALPLSTVAATTETLKRLSPPGGGAPGELV